MRVEKLCGHLAINCFLSFLRIEYQGECGKTTIFIRIIGLFVGIVDRNRQTELLFMVVVFISLAYI